MFKNKRFNNNNNNNNNNHILLLLSSTLLLFLVVVVVIVVQVMVVFISSSSISLTRTQNYERQLLSSSCLSVRPPVCLSTWNNAAPTGRIFIKFDI